MSDAETFLQRLNARLDELHLTKADLARKLGVAYSSVDRWYHGSTPHPLTLTKLAGLLKVTPAWLRSGEEQAALSEDPLIYAPAGAERPEAKLTRIKILVDEAFDLVEEGRRGNAAAVDQASAILDRCKHHLNMD